MEPDLYVLLDQQNLSHVLLEHTIHTFVRPHFWLVKIVQPDHTVKVSILPPRLVPAALATTALLVARQIILNGFCVLQVIIVRKDLQNQVHAV